MIITAVCVTMTKYVFKHSETLLWLWGHSC